jgi:hypothetical protein
VRWRAKASKMMNRPMEKDQVNMVMKGLLPVYYNRMFASPIMDFEQLCNSGMRIEDAIDNGQLDKREGRISIAPKKTFGSSSKMSNIQANINAVQPNQYKYERPPQHQYQNAYLNPSRQGPKPKRNFDPLRASLSKVFKHMCKRGHLRPLDPTPYLDLPPKNWNTNFYCLFHQKTGHSTDECTPLKHEFKISSTMMSFQSLGLPINPMCTRIRFRTIKEHLLQTKSISLKYYKEIGY